MEEFEDPKGEIRIRISKNIQHNGQKEKVQKDKQRSTKHTHKTQDRVTRTPLKAGVELRCSGRVSSSCSTNGTRRFNLRRQWAVLETGEVDTSAVHLSNGIRLYLVVTTSYNSKLNGPMSKIATSIQPSRQICCFS